jgi:hypothetical protein
VQQFVRIQLLVLQAGTVTGQHLSASVCEDTAVGIAGWNCYSFIMLFSEAKFVRAKFLQFPVRTTNSVAFSPSGRRLSAKLVPTIAGREVSRGLRNGSLRPLLTDIYTGVATFSFR